MKLKTMKLAGRLLFSALIGMAYATPEPAAVYLFQGSEWPGSAKPPFITPEEARVILAHRLGVPQYHSVAHHDWIPHINTFGRPQHSEIPELVLIVEGVSSKTAGSLASTFLPLWTAFKISNPPSSTWTTKLVQDLQEQIGSSQDDCEFVDDVDPFIPQCWNGKSKIVRIDLAAKSPTMKEISETKDKLIKHAKDLEMNVMVVLMPESCRSAHTYSNPYGSYDMPSQVQFERRDGVEEPMTESLTEPSAMDTQINDNSSAPITGVPPVCYSSQDGCTSSTRNCSGHGNCYKKSGIRGDPSAPACWACMCEPTTVETNKSLIITYWGGAACQKEDISSSFWLLLVVSLVLVGIVSWGISMLFSIGEEKLPGVIGAGVSHKAR